MRSGCTAWAFVRDVVGTLVRRAMRLPDAARCGTAAASCGMSCFSSLPPALSEAVHSSCSAGSSSRKTSFARSASNCSFCDEWLSTSVNSPISSDAAAAPPRNDVIRPKLIVFPPRNRERLSG